jgi:multicomponent Na+:H+ antiporter subunit G
VTAWVSAILIVVGASALLLAAIGILRFPDVLTRMQAAAKAGTLGVGCLLAAAAAHFAQIAVTAHVVLIILFFLLTSPIAAHRIGRAAHRIGVPLWKGTHRDELREPGGLAGDASATGDLPE